MWLMTIGRGALVAGTLVLLAGCGDDDGQAQSGGASESSEGPATEVPEGAPLLVVAEDVSFPEESYSANAGQVDVTYRNGGNIGHTLVIEDVDGFKLTVTANGDADEGRVVLEPGQYTMFCDVPGHREAGMVATLDVS